VVVLPDPEETVMEVLGNWTQIASNLSHARVNERIYKKPKFCLYLPIFSAVY